LSSIILLFVDAAESFIMRHQHRTDIKFKCTYEFPHNPKTPTPPFTPKSNTSTRSQNEIPKRAEIVVQTHFLSQQTLDMFAEKMEELIYPLTRNPLIVRNQQQQQAASRILSKSSHFQL